MKIDGELDASRIYIYICGKSYWELHAGEQANKKSHGKSATHLQAIVFRY